MKYLVPLNCDARKEPIGLFSVTTTSGPIVILFGSKVRWDRFASAVGAVLAKDKHYLGSVEIEADSVNDVVDRLSGMYPAIVDEATFVPDTAPIVKDVLEFFDAQA